MVAARSDHMHNPPTEVSASSSPVLISGSGVRIGPRFYLLYALFALLVFPLHELGHYVTYRILGVSLQMTLNTASPQDQGLRKPIAEIAGPLLNLVLAFVATALFLISHRGRQVFAALALAAAMMRLVVYALVLGATLVTGSGMTLGNDEPIAARLWGLPSLAFVIILAIPFAIVVWLIFRDVRASAVGKALHVAGLALVMFSVGMVVGNVLDPFFFPGR